MSSLTPDGETLQLCNSMEHTSLKCGNLQPEIDQNNSQQTRKIITDPNKKTRKLAIVLSTCQVIDQRFRSLINASTSH